MDYANYRGKKLDPPIILGESIANNLFCVCFLQFADHAFYSCCVMLV